MFPSCSGQAWPSHAGQTESNGGIEIAHCARQGIYGIYKDIGSLRSDGIAGGGPKAFQAAVCVGGTGRIPVLLLDEWAVDTS
jgi:hypothetical protein